MVPLFLSFLNILVFTIAICYLYFSIISFLLFKEEQNNAFLDRLSDSVIIANDIYNVNIAVEVLILNNFVSKNTIPAYNILFL